MKNQRGREGQLKKKNPTSGRLGREESLISTKEQRKPTISGEKDDGYPSAVQLTGRQRKEDYDRAHVTRRG